MIFSLQELYDLKNVQRFTARISVGRLFVYKNFFGLTDISGALWPVVVSKQTVKLKAGDVIQFSGCFLSNIFYVKKIVNFVIQKEESKNNPCLSFNFDHYSALKGKPETLNRKKLRTKFFPNHFLQNRSKILEKRFSGLERTKQFFLNRNFFYAQTPLLVPSGGMETYLHTFQTTYRDYNGRDWTFELPTSPEFSLKKLVGEGFQKIFQIAHAFRNNGELSPFHEPEFLMLEWYRVGGTLKDIMFDTQKLVLTLAKYLNSKKRIPKTWKTFKVHELFLNLMNLDLSELQDTKKFYEKSQHISTSLRSSDTWDDIFCKLFMEKVEPFLKKQTACFVTEYPAQMGALAMNVENNPLFVQRTEAYLFGIEICNGYQELVDANEFKARLEKVVKQKSGHLKRDIDFENTMNFGLPHCAGNALGIDRVIALLLGLDNIQALLPISFSRHFKAC